MKIPNSHLIIIAVAWWSLIANSTFVYANELNGPVVTIQDVIVVLIGNKIHVSDESNYFTDDLKQLSGIYFHQGNHAREFDADILSGIRRYPWSYR